ncbi:uncharacterized protein LOC143636849 [Bidens hawaiensis]|uniref:uncharacterized protein LOC143636849 n=1 Tax=Bidens hawaiensis TaxID=980011 RepID=UPI00404AE1E2
MKENKADVVVKETVDCTKSDEKIEAIFGEREPEDMVVDVDTVDSVPSDRVMEDAGAGKEVGVVVEEVREENIVVTVEPAVEEAEAEVEVKESVEEVVVEETEKESEVLDYLKVSESTEGDNKVVDVSTKSTEVEAKESLEKTVEVADSRESGNVDEGVTEEVVTEVTESVKEADGVDSVMSEETKKDEVLDDTKVQDAVSEAAEVAGKDETRDGESKDQSKGVAAEGLKSTIDALESGKETETEESKLVFEPEILIEEIDVVDKVDDEQSVKSVQEAVVEDPGSPKVPRSSIMASLGLEEADVDVVDEGTEEKTEDKDPVSVEPSLVNAEVVNVGTGEVGQKTAVDSTGETVKPDEVVIAEKEPSSDMQVSTEPDVVAYTEPESATDKVTPGDEITTSQTEHVPATNAEFTYEDVHMERAEDVGMDIDEVLGWKDEIPPVQEHGHKVDPAHVEVPLQQSCYFHPPVNEGEFSVSDLVWGKVRTHPWWPGQIFDPSDASEKATKHHKKDCFLVAYFGDRTFAWNDAAVLKPFRENFSQVVDRIDSEAFNNAVHCALQEVSRRVELGLTCSCIPREIFENIKCQIVENSGIKQESSRRHGVDESASVNSFEPNMLVDYVKLLAKFPHGEGDKMELTIAKAQLSSYCQFKGHRQLAEFQLCGELLDADQQVVKEESDSEDGSRKRKALDSLSDTVYKVGGSIQKVATQLTGLVGPVDQVQGPVPTGNQADMLSQLHQTAQDPMKGYGFVNNIIPFFNTHRDTVLSKSRKRKTSNENENENFEFDDVNDSYWTDRIIQNHPEENPGHDNNQNGGGSHQMMAYEQEKQTLKPARRSNKKRFFSSNHEIEAKEQSELIERRRKNLATEVLMKFTEGVHFPSEIHLNKMFKRFGPLMESETEVDRQSGRARVVFKKCSDAEVAQNSAAKFNIFGAIYVNYEINYTPLISYKPLPLSLAQDPPHAG